MLEVILLYQKCYTSLHQTHIQALTVPIQGFLNALAYGWTRGDFKSVMSLRHLSSQAGSPHEVQDSKSRTKRFMRRMEESKAKLSGKSFGTYLLKQEAMQELLRWWDILLECRLTMILLSLHAIGNGIETKSVYETVNFVPCLVSPLSSQYSCVTCVLAELHN